MQEKSKRKQSIPKGSCRLILPLILYKYFLKIMFYPLLLFDYILFVLYLQAQYLCFFLYQREGEGNLIQISVNFYLHFSVHQLGQALGNG